MAQIYHGPERRKYIRAPKSFSLVFYCKEVPEKKFTGTFIKDIGKGGLRFTSSTFIKVGTDMVFEVGIPFVAPNKLIIEGVVVSIKEISKLVHEIRAKFNPMGDHEVQMLDMIEKQNLKGQKNYGLS